MTKKNISVSMQIIHAEQILIRSMFVIIRHVMDTRHSVYPSLILMHCDSILRIIADRVSVDTQRLNYLLIVKEEDKRVGEIRRKNINKIISVLHIKKKKKKKKRYQSTLV
jgi:hypothetical protein